MKQLVAFLAMVICGILPAIAGVTVDAGLIVGQSPAEFGSNIFWTDQDGSLLSSRWNEAGLKTMRLPLVQYFIEPVNDNEDPHTINQDGFLFDTPIPLPPDFTRTFTLDELFITLRDMGSTLMLNPVYLSDWLSANPVPDPFEGWPGEAYSTFPPDDLDEYEEYIRAILTHLVVDLQYPPHRLILDAVNEPDLGCGTDPAVACFWDDWQMNDLVDVLQVSRTAVDSVSPEIRMYGVAQCCGSSIIESVMDDYNGADILDGLSYHKYVHTDFSPAVSQGTSLKAYGLPVVCNEYGSFAYLSDGMAGARWHAGALPMLWGNGIEPIQYPFSEKPGGTDPYNSMGIVADWTTGWEPKPSFQVYANFFNSFAGSELLQATADPEFTILAGLCNIQDCIQSEVSIWINNFSGTSLTDVPFSITSFPQSRALITVRDNFSGTDPIEQFIVNGTPILFNYDIPAGSSFTFTVSPRQANTLAADLACTPASGTLPFMLVQRVMLSNRWDSPRRFAARINARFAGGQFIENWKSGWSNVSSGSILTVSWNQNFPAVRNLVGSNYFQLVAQDVTPSPYNQTPNPPAGDTETDICKVTGTIP